VTKKRTASIESRLAAIVAEIDRTGHADLLRLTVLKRWLEQPPRLGDFGLWVATRAAARGETGADEAGALLARAQVLLPASPPAGARPDRAGIEGLYLRLCAFQAQTIRQRWGPVRLLRNHDLLLIEDGLALYLGLRTTPADGYRLAAEYCAHYDSRYGRDLNGPSRDRLLELIGFVTAHEGFGTTTALVTPRRGCPRG
jgi:hypothetical protein